MLNEGIGKKPKPFSYGMFVSAFQAQLRQHLGVISRSAAGPEQPHTKARVHGDNLHVFASSLFLLLKKSRTRLLIKVWLSLQF